jgi:membrane-bound lytic murein transglycosylase F
VLFYSHPPLIGDRSFVLQRPAPARVNTCGTWGAHSPCMRKLPLALAILLPVICDPGFVPHRPVAPLSKTGELVVLTTNSTTTRYIDSLGNYSGLEYELVEMFAAELGVRVHYLDRQPLYQILRSLRENTAHFAAAGIAVTSSRLDHFQFGPSYQMVQQVLAYNTDTPMPRELKDLARKHIEVVRGSSAVEQLELLRRREPKLKWIEVSESDSETLLARLSEGKVDYVVTDAHTLDIVRRFHPNLARAWAIGDPEPLAWAFPRQGDPYVIARAEEFFLRLIYDGTLRRMLERYYGHVGRLDQLDVARFLTAMRTQLPDYRALFQEAQELTGIDWRLIAALGFQESHWNPAAVSPTGVRGLMMLTADTADRMDVSNRLDARQSIIAGARYLLELREMLPQKAQEPDRTWLALAAYNLGLGHVEDARVLAQRHGLNPNLWVDVKQMLPLLSRYEHYSTVKRGFCRGSEGLALTENIRNYYDILASFEPPHATGLTPFVQSGRSGEQRPMPAAPPL